MLNINKAKYIFGLFSLAIALDVQAQLVSEGPAMFLDVSEPWLSLFTLGVGIGLLVILSPYIVMLIDTVSSIIDLPDNHSKNGLLTTGTLILSCICSGLVIYVIVVAASGTFQGQIATSGGHWTYLILAGVLLACALSLFGFYEFRPTESIQSRLQNSVSQTLGSGIGAVFLLGVALAVIVGVCFAPFLMSVTGTVASVNNLVLALIMILVFSAGIFLVLSAIKFQPLYVLPQKQGWRLQIQRILGILLTAAAIHLLGAFPSVPVLFLWAILLIVASIYLGATRKIPQSASASQQLLKGAGIAVLIWGGISLVGASVGNRDISRPLPQLSAIIANGGLTVAGKTQTPSKGVFTYVKNIDEFDQLMMTAKLDSKATVLDFYADWCLDCKRMDRSTFQNPSVVARLSEDFLALKIDVTDPDDEFGRALRKRFGVFGPPALVLFDAQGNPVKNLLTYGFLNVRELMELLSKV